MNQRHRQKRREALLYLPALPRSIWYNFKLLPFAQARHLPLLLSHRTKVHNLSGSITLSPDQLRIGLIKIGFASYQGTDFRRDRTQVDLRGTLVAGGECAFGAGSCVEVSENGVLTVGNRFHLGPKSLLICHHRMPFGESVRISWCCTLMDTDQHALVDADGNVVNPDRPIRMGDNVWIGCHTIVTKGVELAGDTTVAAGARLSGRHEEPLTVLAGNPAVVVRHQVKREN